MIPIFKDGTPPVRLAHAYNGLTLNNPADSSTSTYEINSVVLMPQYAFLQDAKQDEDGSTGYDVTKPALLLRVDGTIRGSTLIDFHDKIVALAAAFDPAKVWYENATTQGFLPYTFSLPSSHSLAVSNLLACYYNLRARRIELPPISQYTGTAGFFGLDLIAIDPRRYWQTGSTLSGAGTATNSGNYRTFPVLTITASGAGSATYRFNNAHTNGSVTSPSLLVLDLSGLVNNDVVVVNFAKRTITKNGVDAPTLWVSGTFSPLQTGANTITYTNGTNMTSVLTWNHAWTP